MDTGDENYHDGEDDMDELSMEDKQENTIESLLEEGYNQLDGFAAWLEAEKGFDARSAEMDRYNAESLIEYLGNNVLKTAFTANEFDLRWFIFSHFIRKAMAEPVIELRLVESLERFYKYLELRCGFAAPPWLQGVWDDTDYYINRHAQYESLEAENEQVWQQGFREWCRELEEDLDLRGIWPTEDLGEGMGWGDAMGIVEYGLHLSAIQQWQEGRLRYIDEGWDVAAIRERLGKELRLWMDTPQDRLDNGTPRQAILDERSSTRLHAEESGVYTETDTGDDDENGENDE